MTPMRDKLCDIVRTGIVDDEPTTNIVFKVLDALMSPTEGMLGSVVEHGVISYGGAKHAFTGMIRAAKEGK